MQVSSAMLCETAGHISGTQVQGVLEVTCSDIWSFGGVGGVGGVGFFFGFLGFFEGEL